MRKGLGVVVTCEHGGNRVPRRYLPLFSGHGRMLEGHRGYDEGALDIARALSRTLNAELFHSTMTRLLVDLNRSQGNPRVFSEISRTLPAGERKALLHRYHEPYRRKIEGHVRRLLHGGARVLHISVHTFSPRLNGQERRADIGLLYDPSRSRERDICSNWKRTLASTAPGLKVRRNYPYLGVSDGLTSHLRGLFSDREYAGVELEVNQRLLASGSSARARHVAAIAASLAQLSAAGL